MSNRPVILCGWVLLLLSCSLGRAETDAISPNEHTAKERPVTIDLQTPRDYGYTLGDRITIIARINMPMFYRLEINSLPKPGPINDWLQLIEATPVETQTDYDYALALTYQVFKSVPVATELTLPPLPLHFSYHGRSLIERLPAWTFGYNPLIPKNKTDAQIEPEPEMAPELMETDDPRRRLGYFVAAIATLLFYIAWFYGKAPFLERYSGAFGKACRTLKQLKKHPPSEETHRKALQCFHHALNELSGESVFAGQLPAFFQRFPKFAPLQEKTEALFRVSQQLFFNASPETPTSVDIEQIEALCLHYRKLERSLR